MNINDVVGRVSSIITDTGKQIGDIVTEKTKEAKGYAKDTVDLMSLKNQVTSCKEVIKTNYQTLGEYYYKKYSEDPAADVVDAVRAIENAEETIKELESKIQEIKDSQAEFKAAKAAAAEEAKAEGVVADVDAEIQDVAAGVQITEEAIDKATEAVDKELDEIKPE